MMDGVSEMKVRISDWDIIIIMLSKLIHCDCLPQLRVCYTFNVKKSALGLISVVQTNKSSCLVYSGFLLHILVEEYNVARTKTEKWNAAGISRAGKLWFSVSITKLILKLLII